MCELGDIKAQVDVFPAFMGKISDSIDNSLIFT